MPDGANELAAVPVPSPGAAGPAVGKRGRVLLGLGFGVGLAVGVLLATAVTATYTFLTDTLPSTRESVQVFNELNELRQQLNQLNEENKRKEQEKEQAVRQALSAVASTTRAPDGRTPDAAPPAEKPGGGADRPPVEKRQDPFADIDAEIERLEQAQKTLNTILDMFSRKGKEPAKDR
jgi:hypothetical protein